VETIFHSQTNYAMGSFRGVCKHLYFVTTVVLEYDTDVICPDIGRPSETWAGHCG